MNNLTDFDKQLRKSYWKYKLTKHLPKPLRYIKATILCIRFPFLYPRNVWVNKHYNNWKLHQYHKKYWTKAYEWKEDKWVTKDKWFAFKIKVADFLNSFLGIFHFLPSYTLLDSMPKGWRKCFGIQMCKEVKKALLDTGGIKYLMKYRIIDIKQKYGSLSWYDSYSCDEVSNIIYKYGYISEHTCIKCGKTAKYITRGWVSPYCEKCITESEKKNSDEYYIDMPFYGVRRYSFNKNNKEDEVNEMHDYKHGDD